jgi:hypothetical protein
MTILAYTCIGSLKTTLYIHGTIFNQRLLLQRNGQPNKSNFIALGIVVGNHSVNRIYQINECDVSTKQNTFIYFTMQILYTMKLLVWVMFVHFAEIASKQFLLLNNVFVNLRQLMRFLCKKLKRQKLKPATVSGKQPLRIYLRISIDN